MFMFCSNEPIKVAHLQNLNQSMLNDALVTDMVKNLFSDRNLVVWWSKIRAAKNIFPLDFAKYLSYLEVQKNSDIVNVQTVYWNKSLVSECSSKFVPHRGSCRWSEICYV